MLKGRNSVITEKKSRLLGIALPVILAGNALDRAVKYIAEIKIKPEGTVKFIPGLLQLTYAENTGAAFSLMKGWRWFLIPVTAVVLAVIIFLMLRGFFKSILSFVSVSFVVAGALGNFVDRVRQGYVVDMFEPVFINFAIFNVADVFLTLGGITLALSILLARDGKKSEPDKQTG